jgi:hypothetical protein
MSQSQLDHLRNLIHTQRSELYNYRHQIGDLQKKLALLQEENQKLHEWKRQAMTVMPDVQKISELLNVDIDDDIPFQIIARIKALKKQNEILKFKISGR